MGLGLAQDPRAFLAALKAAGDLWTPMAAARLVLGARADTLRDAMGDAWMSVAIAAELEAAEARGDWSFAHSTLRAWLSYQAGRLDEGDYRRQLVECAEDGKAEFLRPTPAAIAWPGAS